MRLDNRTVLIGDVMDKVKEIPNETIDCIISSPPYWALRDYGTGKQWGMEEDFHDYLKRMNSLMQELRRILKPTGSVWINLGDTYSSSGSGTNSKTTGLHGKDCTCQTCKATDSTSYYRKHLKYIQTKSRIGIPERFYINCIDDGWIARNHIPWIKPNAMPSSVQDRFTNKWESIFFFAKKQKYYFNLDAVREDTITELKPPKERKKGKMNPLFDITETKSETSQKKQDTVIDPNTGKPKQTYAGFNDRYKDRKMLEVPGQNPHTMHVKREEGMSDYEYQQKGNHQPEGRSHFGTGSDIKQNMLKARQKKEDAWKYDDIGAQGQAKSLKERQAYARRVLGLDHDSCLNDPRGKNPGDVVYDHSKPYAVVERFGEVIFRKLPSHDDVREYLSEWRNKSGYTIDQVEEQFGNQAGHHWFEKDGSYPSVSDWLNLKKLFNFDDT